MSGTMELNGKRHDNLCRRRRDKISLCSPFQHIVDHYVCFETWNLACTTLALGGARSARRVEGTFVRSQEAHFGVGVKGDVLWGRGCVVVVFCLGRRGDQVNHQGRHVHCCGSMVPANMSLFVCWQVASGKWQEQGKREKRHLGTNEFYNNEKREAGGRGTTKTGTGRSGSSDSMNKVPHVKVGL